MIMEDKNEKYKKSPPDIMTVRLEISPQDPLFSSFLPDNMEFNEAGNIVATFDHIAFLFAAKSLNPDADIDEAKAMEILIQYMM